MINDAEWQIYRSIELEWIKKECLKELDDELEEDKEDTIYLSPKIALLIYVTSFIFLFIFLYLVIFDTMAIYYFFELPILKPILIVAPTGCYGLYVNYKQKKRMTQKIKELELKWGRKNV